MEGVIDQLVHNQFPAVVFHPDGTQTNRVRAVLSRDLLVLYGETTEDGKRHVRTLRKVEVTASRPEGRAWIAVDPDGGEWKILKSGWCGCGSMLKSMPSPLPIDL